MESQAMLSTFLEQVADKVERDRAQITRCTNLLANDEFWYRPNEHCNSVGNLMLHLTGNVRQWIIGGLARQDISRDRPAEFAQRTPLPTERVMPPFETAVATACDVIRRFDATQLGDHFDIQGYAVSGLYAVFHVAEHFSFHTGQIVHITKTIRNVDLSLYDPQGRPVGTTRSNP